MVAIPDSLIQKGQVSGVLAHCSGKIKEYSLQQIIGYNITHKGFTASDNWLPGDNVVTVSFTLF
jgi:hypothetical protein